MRHDKIEVVVKKLIEDYSMSESKDYLEMSFRSIECFTNDGKLDAEELGKILDIAEKDGVIDHNEIRVLTRIITKIRPEEVDADMQAKLDEIMEKVKAQTEQSKP